LLKIARLIRKFSR